LTVNLLVIVAATNAFDGKSGPIRVAEAQITSCGDTGHVQRQAIQSLVREDVGQGDEGGSGEARGDLGLGAVNQWG
jgi:hypothetical protein